jgi:DNA-binding MarR family transcriptional regulator
MVVTIDQLEAAGLARRQPSPTDRRVRIVQTTEAGDQVVAQARKIMDEVYAEVLGGLPDGERNSLLDALVRLVGPAGPLHAAPPVASARRRPSRPVRS